MANRLLFRTALCFCLLVICGAGVGAQRAFDWKEVDRPPFFPKRAADYARDMGPDLLLQSAIYTQLTYPKKALHREYGGTAWVTFSVSETGKIELDSSGIFTPQEAERAISADSASTIFLWGSVSCRFRPIGAPPLPPPPPLTEEDIRAMQQSFVREARRVVSELPRAEPARHRGREVRVRHRLIFDFSYGFPDN